MLFKRSIQICRSTEKGGAELLADPAADSPYQSFSTYAGNPYFIDLKTLVKEGLLTKKECKEVRCKEQKKIDYEKIYQNRFKILKKAYRRFQKNDKYEKFLEENAFWLEDYCMYMAIKDAHEGKSWSEWEELLKKREKTALEKVKEELEDEIGFYQFQQYEFDRQWKKLHTYAKEQGIQIIGDIPIYVAFDSADAWAAPELFQFDEENNPIRVAGCPPDAFAKTGQLWGNPLYNWEYHQKTGYAWWIQRIRYCFQRYDVGLPKHTIISEDLMNIMQFHTVSRLRKMEHGCPDRE